MKKDENEFIISEPLQSTIEATDDRLFKAACAAMTGILANQTFTTPSDIDCKIVSYYTINLAKELIKQLDNQ